MKKKPETKDRMWCDCIWVKVGEPAEVETEGTAVVGLGQ